MHHMLTIRYFDFDDSVIKHQKHGCVVYVSSNPVPMKSV